MSMYIIERIYKTMIMNLAKNLNHVSRIGITVLLWLFFMITALLIFPVYLFVWLITAPFDKDRVVLFNITSFWALILLRINPFWNIKVTGREQIIKNRPVVYVANHQSMLDILLLYILRVRFKWIAKKELAKAPLIGWMLYLNKDILIDRKRKRSGLEMMNNAKQVLARNISIVMFPEGTRSRTSDLRPFKDGAFKIAREASVAIHPVIIKGTGEALPKNSFIFSQRNVIHVHILQPVSSATIGQSDITELKASVRNRMTSYLS